MDKNNNEKEKQKEKELELMFLRASESRSKKLKELKNKLPPLIKSKNEIMKCWAYLTHEERKSEEFLIIFSFKGFFIPEMKKPSQKVL